ncbi:XRE family transcriptional regulator [Paraburkholderia sp. UYCP14C]|uniref:helix-turn-helix domain-containing protein n=1 Tax=Paraburkholderia sp. UYCP14C TaxID=2511130 RepID=UPI00101FB38F|nr:XRE family transcriptional regulator [Paraburkholderia sp. UYCP14C]RZF26713.1 XRE family transcriptional regulator [Paraburkholderia sp. UYCP14C]
MQNGEDSKTSLERYLGATIRELRQRHGLTIAQVSEQAGISRGMLSKIENAQTSTGLDVLNRIANALGVSMSTLFRRFDVPEGGAQLVKKGEGMEVVRKGTRRGHTYHLLAYDQGPKKLFEPFLITMDDESEIFPVFEHQGTEFIHMLKGVIEYRHGQQTYILHPGDTITFQADVPHGPERLIKTPIQFLSIFLYGQDDRD